MRDATSDDLTRIVEMSREFCSVARPDVEFDAFSASGTVASLIRRPDGIMLVSDSGMLGGLVYPISFNTSYLIAQEVMWWGDIGLIDLFERRGREMGAREFIMLCMENIRPDVMARFYRSRGYRPMERSFVKEA